MNSLIDIGANLTSGRFAGDLDAVLVRARQAGLVNAIVTGTSVAESAAALELTRRHADFLYCTAGVHPHNARHWDEAAREAIRVLLAQSSVVAVGECGLDFNRDFSPRDQQENCFAQQLELAAETGKPVFLHERDAHQRFVDILGKMRDRLPGAVVHCFTGNSRELKAYLDLDCHIGITGWLCDERRSDDLREAVKYLPLERLLLETDAPYLTPRTIRPRPNRNEPAFLPYLLPVLSELLQKPASEIAATATANSRTFFGLRPPEAD